MQLTEQVLCNMALILDALMAGPKEPQPPVLHARGRRSPASVNLITSPSRAKSRSPPAYPRRHKSRSPTGLRGRRQSRSRSPSWCRRSPEWATARQPRERAPRCVIGKPLDQIRTNCQDISSTCGSTEAFSGTENTRTIHQGKPYTPEGATFPKDEFECAEWQESPPMNGLVEQYAFQGVSRARRGMTKMCDASTKALQCASGNIGENHSQQEVGLQWPTFLPWTSRTFHATVLCTLPLLTGCILWLQTVS